MVSNDDIDTHFDSPESLIEEAEDALTVFTSSLGEFRFRNKPTIISDPEPKTGNQIIKVRFPNPSRTIRRSAYRVVDGARHALDQAVYAATICFDGKTGGTKTYFPFGMNPDDFDNQFKVIRTPNGKKLIGRTKDATPRIAHTIKAFEPWWTSIDHLGGNDLLRFLGKIANPNKHEVTLTVIPNIDGNWINDAAFKGVAQFTMPPKRIGTTNDFQIVSLFQGGHLKYDGGFSYNIGLSQTHPNVPRGAIDALSKMVDISKNLVFAIKDVCIRELT